MFVDGFVCYIIGYTNDGYINSDQPYTLLSNTCLCVGHTL